jgi:hypothetical protein
MDTRHAALLLAIAASALPMDLTASLARGPAGTAWIAPGDPPSPGNTPCPLLRGVFELPAGPVSGKVRVVGLGHFELYLNGSLVGESLVNQPWSQYDRTIYYQEFDVRSLLKKGKNAWGVLLGNSFWDVTAANDTGRFVKTDAMPDFSAGNPYLLWLEARIRTRDGGEVLVTSDGSWRWIGGPLTFSHIYAGEDFDARLLPSGWSTPAFDDSGWKPVRTVAPPAAKIEAFSAPPLKAFELFRPVKILSPSPGEYTYIFPQNCSALLRFTVEGAPGQTIRFRPCEYVDSAGHVRFTYTWGTNKDIWHDYTLRGSGSESHQTKFCYVGCQYVGVTGAVPQGRPNPMGLPVIKRLELLHVRGASAIAGTFSSSNHMQNRAHHMIDWSIRSNMSYILTDCPHREKNGWQEQNWHMARAISYRFDVRSLYAKIARDLRDAQLPDGHIPTNCPNYLVGILPHGYWNESAEWGISGVLVPWHLYEWYGDTVTLAESFESMRRYVDYLSSQAKDGVITSNLGDWYDYGHGKGDGPSQWTPNEVTATAVWALGASTVSRAAAVLGKKEAEAVYAALFARIREDFQRKFYDRASKRVANRGSCQAGHSIALCAGLVPEGDREAVLQAIVDDLRARGWQQTVGEVTQVFFVRALAEGGRNDVLHKVYSREERGGYGYMVRQGFTTLPESWDARPGTPNSMNHFMLGHLMEWHFAYVAGIRQAPGSVGWRSILIAPNPGSLEHAAARFDSPSGQIKVSWKKRKGIFEMYARVPKGTAAEAILPNGERHVLRGGVMTRLAAFLDEEKR